MPKKRNNVIDLIQTQTNENKMARFDRDKDVSSKRTETQHLESKCKENSYPVELIPTAITSKSPSVNYIYI
jgi:hypothetical protein